MTADDRGPTTWEEIRNECETCKELYTTSEMGTLFYILREENRQIDLGQIPVYTIRSIPSHLDHVTIIRSVYRGILGQRRFNQSYMDNGFHHLSSSLPCLFTMQLWCLGTLPDLVKSMAFSLVMLLCMTTPPSFSQTRLIFAVCLLLVVSALPLKLYDSLSTWPLNSWRARTAL